MMAANYSQEVKLFIMIDETKQFVKRRSQIRRRPSPTSTCTMYSLYCAWTETWRGGRVTIVPDLALLNCVSTGLKFVGRQVDFRVEGSHLGAKVAQRGA